MLPDSDDMEADAAAGCAGHHEDVESSFRQSTHGSFGIGATSFVGCGPIVSCVGIVRGNSCDGSGVDTAVIGASVVYFVSCGPVVSCVDRVESKSYDAVGVDTAVGSAPGDDNTC